MLRVVVQQRHAAAPVPVCCCANKTRSQRPQRQRRPAPRDRLRTEVADWPSTVTSAWFPSKGCRLDRVDWRRSYKAGQLSGSTWGGLHQRPLAGSAPPSIGRVPCARLPRRGLLLTATLTHVRNQRAIATFTTWHTQLGSKVRSTCERTRQVQQQLRMRQLLWCDQDNIHGTSPSLLVSVSVQKKETTQARRSAIPTRTPRPAYCYRPSSY